MTRSHYIIATAISALCAVLALATVLSARASVNLQRELQEQQTEINKGTLSNQVGLNLVRDIAEAAIQNEAMKALLARHGFTLTVNPPSDSASVPGAASSPAASPSPATTEPPAAAEASPTP